MPTAEEFIDVMRIAVRQAGSVALHLQSEVRNVGKQGMMTPEGAALTSVDLACQDLLLHALRPMSDVSIDAEEDTPLVGAFPPGREHLVVLDPIDGTLNYVEQSPDFAVMGALVHQGIYIAAVLHYPRRDFSAWAIRGQGCWREDRDLGPRPVRLPIPAPHTVLVSPHLEAPWRRKLEAAGLPLTTSRCSAFDATAPALGFAEASLGMGPPDRRGAIGYLVTTEAGGRSHR